MLRNVLTRLKYQHQDKPNIVPQADKNLGKNEQPPSLKCVSLHHHTFQAHLSLPTGQVLPANQMQFTEHVRPGLPALGAMQAGSHNTKCHLYLWDGHHEQCSLHTANKQCSSTKNTTAQQVDGVQSLKVQGWMPCVRVVSKERKEEIR